MFLDLGYGMKSQGTSQTLLRQAALLFLLETKENSIKIATLTLIFLEVSPQ